MTKEEYINIVNENELLDEKEKKKLVEQIKKYYEAKNSVIDKDKYNVGDTVKLKKGTLLHGTYKNLDGLKEILKDGLISSWFIDGRLSKYPSSVGVWNLKNDYDLKDYINYYSGGTIMYCGIFENGVDTQKNQTAVIPYNEMNNIIDTVSKIDCHMWTLEQTKEARFMPSLVQNRVQIGIIFNGNNKYALELLKGDILDLSNLNDKEVKPVMKYACRKGPRCELIDMCFNDSDSPNSMFRLTNWNVYGGNYRLTEQWIAQGNHLISELDPNPFPVLKKNGEHCNAFTQVEYQKGNIKEKYVISRRLIKDIIERDYYNSDIEYLLFFDFESFQYPIPLVEHSHPWKQIVSQYSMHVVKKGYDLTKHDFAKGKGGDVSHYEYIANPDITKYENPSIELYKTLKAQLEESGIDPYASNYRVVVFNQNFEKTRMSEFAIDFSSLCDSELIRFVNNFNNNVVDLLDFFTSGSIYCIDFNGRGSLKVVQPTLAADQDVLDFYNKKLPFDLTYSLDYHKGEKCLVYNGGICLDLYKSLLVRSHLNEQDKGPSTQDLLNEALAYCKIDSWGTVIIYDIIKNIYLGELKIDAKEV